ncbi:MAG TPA: D-aminoacylase [Candidatus Eisenbacteria bacterium]|nr:D-aminoacylase [Candidatus Eisenbacteria bacterium]
MTYDLAIRGGMVVDGTGAPGRRADLAIDGDRIAVVGSPSGDARRTIDATGRVVAPGFIDVHSHDDFALLGRPACEAKVMQGVTSVVIGNCGFGAAPLGPAYLGFLRSFGPTLFGPLGDPSWHTTDDFFRLLEREPPSVNVAALVPHATVRMAVLGGSKREPNPSELEAMRDIVREAMQAGAVGMSTGLFYAPGSYATTEEVIEVARVVGEGGGVYATHLRDEADGLLDSVAEALRIGEEAGVAVQLSHHKAMGERNWGMVERSLAMIDAVRGRGADVTLDVYPYTSLSTTLVALRDAGVLETVPPAAVWIATMQTLHELEGKSLADVCMMWGATSAREAADLLFERDGRGIIAIVAAMDERDVRRVLAHPATMIGSDGVPSVDGKPHPRLYGTFARVLQVYVREQGVLSLEEAVHRMTGLSARRFGLADRGMIAEGRHADVVVFDPKTVATQSTYEDPRQYPVGMDAVVVNGDVVVDRGAHTGARAGRMLRSRARA